MDRLSSCCRRVEPIDGIDPVYRPLVQTKQSRGRCTRAARVCQLGLALAALGVAYGLLSQQRSGGFLATADELFGTVGTLSTAVYRQLPSLVKITQASTQFAFTAKDLVYTGAEKTYQMWHAIPPMPEVTCAVGPSTIEHSQHAFDTLGMGLGVAFFPFTMYKTVQAMLRIIARGSGLEYRWIKNKGRPCDVIKNWNNDEPRNDKGLMCVLRSQIFGRHPLVVSHNPRRLLDTPPPPPRRSRTYTLATEWALPIALTVGAWMALRYFADPQATNPENAARVVDFIAKALRATEFDTSAACSYYQYGWTTLAQKLNPAAVWAEPVTSAANAQLMTFMPAMQWLNSKMMVVKAPYSMVKIFTVTAVVLKLLSTLSGFSYFARTREVAYGDPRTRAFWRQWRLAARDWVITPSHWRQSFAERRNGACNIASEYFKRTTVGYYCSAAVSCCCRKKKVKAIEAKSA